VLESMKIVISGQYVSDQWSVCWQSVVINR